MYSSCLRWICFWTILCAAQTYSFNDGVVGLHWHYNACKTHWCGDAWRAYFSGEVRQVQWPLGCRTAVIHVCFAKADVLMAHMSNFPVHWLFHRHYEPQLGLNIFVVYPLHAAVLALIMMLIGHNMLTSCALRASKIELDNDQSIAEIWIRSTTLKNVAVVLNWDSKYLCSIYG